MGRRWLTHRPTAPRPRATGRPRDDNQRGDRAPHQKPPREEQLRILRRLNAAEAFETFLQTKFVGQKRFSLEGGESVIAVLDRILTRAAGEGMDEVCIGMPHRGRLNVLANVLGKSYAKIFGEFEGNIDPGTVQGSGDVKYHLGAEGEFEAGASYKPNKADWFAGRWSGLHAPADAETARQALTSLAAAVRVPQQLTQDNPASSSASRA